MTGAEAVKLVKELAPICKAEGIKRIRVGDLEMEFGTSKVDEDAIKRVQEAFNQGIPTQEDALNWSVPGYVPSSERMPEEPLPQTARGPRP